MVQSKKLEDIAKEAQSKLDDEALRELRETGMLNIFSDSLTALSFNGFTLSECHAALSKVYSDYMHEISFDKFSGLVMRNKELRDAYFMYNKEAMLGFTLRILREQASSGNVTIAYELFRLIYGKDLNTVKDADDEQFSKKTTQTMERILEGLEHLGGEADGE